MGSRREAVLREMGLAPLWRLRRQEESAVAEHDATPAPVVAESAAQQSRQLLPAQPVVRPAMEVDGGGRATRIARLTWEDLEADMADCRACGLCEGRSRVVPGSGDRNARVMFVGEGPGAEEDRQGLPFVGAAGKLLDAMLASIGLKRDSGVYIANTVKCRPPRNRTPEAAEMAACGPYLARQIELVQPELLVALGRPAAQVLLGDPEVRINAVRGKPFSYGEVPVLVTYHPAYLLRNPLDKAKVWEDLCAVHKRLRTD